MLTNGLYASTTNSAAARSSIPSLPQNAAKAAAHRTHANRLPSSRSPSSATTAAEAFQQAQNYALRACGTQPRDADGWSQIGTPCLLRVTLTSLALRGLIETNTMQSGRPFASMAEWRWRLTEAGHAALVTLRTTAYADAI